MGVQDVNTAVTALGAVFSGLEALAAVAVARWQTVFGRRLALESMNTQATVERKLRLEAQRCEAWTAFLRAADAFVDAVWRLGDVDPGSRAEELRAQRQPLMEACSGLRVLGPDAVVRHAEAVAERCARMERYAVRRALVQSALDALERWWCPGNAERCEERCGGSDAHGCAWVAHVMLEGWGDRDEDDRPDDLDHLEYLIRESGVLAAGPSTRSRSTGASRPNAETRSPGPSAAPRSSAVPSACSPATGRTPCSVWSTSTTSRA